MKVIAAIFCLLSISYSGNAFSASIQDPTCDPKATAAKFLTSRFDHDGDVSYVGHVTGVTGLSGEIEKYLVNYFTFDSTVASPSAIMLGSLTVDKTGCTAKNRIYESVHPAASDL